MLKTKSKHELILETFAKSESITECLLAAEDQENHFIEGVKLNDDVVTLRPFIDDETGLWMVHLEVDHGTVVYKVLDEEANKINITTVPNISYIKDSDGLNESDILAVQNKYSSSVDIDLKDIKTLKNAKEILAEDYVLKHIPLANPTGDCAARLVIWHIRAYRKVFMKYHNDFSFLWKQSGYKNARQLAGAMRDRDLL